MSPRYVVLLLSLTSAGCLSPSATRRSPIPDSASQALAEARELQRKGAGLADSDLQVAIERARYHAPDWTAPSRLRDDVYIREHLALEALVRRRAQLAGDPGDPRLLYLTGRLEGPSGAPRFRRALVEERGFAWAHHGLAWTAAGRGDARAAEREERLAMELARDPWERAYYSVSLLAHLLRANRKEEALEVARRMLAESPLEGGDRLWLELEVGLVELRQPNQDGRRAGYRRGLELIRTPEFQGVELERLVAAMRLTSSGDPYGYELELALASIESPLRNRLRAELLLARSASPLATRLIERSYEAQELQGDPLSRRARFAMGDFLGAVESWRASLPAQVFDEDGRLAEGRLRRIVMLARALNDESETAAGRAAAMVRFGAALVDAGWFREARAVADKLALEDLDAALALRAQAVAGLELVDSIRHSLYELEDGRDDRSQGGLLTSTSHGSPLEEARGDELTGGSSHDGLDELLGMMGEEFAAANEWLGGETDPELARAELMASPRLRYGPFATLVHPGPRFSESDQERGIGRAGERVGGLAEQMDRLGRFAVFGEYVGGGGPDGTVLSRLRVEERSGRHLGVQFSGTVAWCEGTDLSGRAARSGARISGAALHEGYWIDIGSIRHDVRRWNSLADDFRGPGAAERVSRVLALRGLPLESPAQDERARRHERRQLQPLLGEADRVRIAVMRDRAADRATAELPLEEISLAELVDVVATHEEGHLCDRTLFLPLSRKLGRVLRLLFEEGFSPEAIQRRLEYRAQLVALCTVDDPRLPLVEVLAAADSGDTGILPHAAAYTEILGDFVAVLDEERAAAPETWAHLSDEHTLVHQLHHLSPEEVRSICLRLAKEHNVGRM